MFNIEDNNNDILRQFVFSNR